MKKYFLIIPLLLIIFCCLIRCKKEEPINIILYDKPLVTIQHYIHGKWRLVYAKGGICGTCLQHCVNCSIEFTPDNKIISHTLTITSDTTTIHWVRDIGTFTNGDSTYVMTFRDIHGVPWFYVIEQIYYDTLIYHDNSSDAVFYHCIKSN